VTINDWHENIMGGRLTRKPQISMNGALLIHKS
jgi:hypothetical protein